MSDELPSLPALRSLGRLADLRPTIVIDSREQDRLVFTRLPSVVSGLRTGDYSALGIEEHFCVERKSISDLVGCCVNSNRDRFENELHRARGYRFARLLVIGTRADIEQENYRSQLPAKVVFSTLSMIEARYNVPVVFIPTPEEAARQVESWAFWVAREVVENANTLLRDNGLTGPAPKPA